MRAGNFKGAADYFEEATYAAAQYDDADTIETSFQELLGLERLLNSQRDLPSFNRAADWAGASDLRKLRVMLLLAAAEREATVAQTGNAAKLVDAGGPTRLSARPAHVARRRQAAVDASLGALPTE